MGDDIITVVDSNTIIGNLGYDINAQTITVAANTGSSNITLPSSEDALDAHAMCKFTVDHKVTAQELLKLQEVAPDYAKEIKENIAKNLARDISHKISYTKKHDKDTDVHHFIGRVWVFTEDELKHILGIRNV
jgi:hypothetical protein